MKNYKFIVIVGFMLCILSGAFAADYTHLVVMSKSEKEKAVSFFDASDIIAEYDDGSVLVQNNEKIKGIIEENSLPIDSSLTAPERYENALENEATLKNLYSNTSAIKEFENRSSNVPGFYIMQFAGPVKQEWLNSLKKDSVDVFMPVPPYGYYVWGANLEGKFSDRKEVKNLRILKSAEKMSKSLLNKVIMQITENGDNKTSCTVRLNVLVYDNDTSVGIQARKAIEPIKKLNFANEKKFYKSVVGTYFEWEIETDLSKISEIAKIPEIFYIELIEKSELCGEREMALNIGKFDSTGNGVLPGASYERWLADKKVNGAGTVVQLVDTGLDRGNSTNQPGTAATDILGRIAGIADYSGDNDGTDKNGHGTLNAGIVAGNPFTRLKDPSNFLVGMGAAPKAKLFATKVSNSTSFYFRQSFDLITQEARSYGASVSLHPWGNSVRTFSPYTGEFSDPPAYSSYAATFDKLTRVANGFDYKEGALPMLFVMSAGNDGWFCDMFACYLVEKTITNPALAKNVISVGAFTGNPPEGGSRKDPVQSTSRGPLQDGRIAPTLVAPGIGITGIASQSDAFQNGNPVYYPEGQTLYTRGNGTSHAAAQVAGGAALFNDWWQRYNNYSSTPSPAMIKAALINGAEDEQGGVYPIEIPSPMFGFGEPVYGEVKNAPDNNQGWGGLNLDKVIPNKGSEKDYIFFDQNTKTFTANGQEWETQIFAIDQNTPLYISLVWTDPANSPSASKALVNDLDLIVTNGADQILYGNSFRNGWSALNGTADRVNNVEVIKIEKPFGVYKLKIKAASLSGKLYGTDSGNSQDFALAVRGARVASKKGVIAFTAPYYRCESQAGLMLADLDLAGTGGGTYTVNVKNQTQNLNVDVQLYENPPNTGLFRGTFNLVSTTTPFSLVAANGDVLYVEYNDADDGTGAAAKPTSSATLDCTAPEVTNFIVSDHSAFSVTLHFTLNKKATGLLRWGTTPGTFTNQYSLDTPSLIHTIPVAALNPCTIYYAQLELVDSVGNTKTDNNDGNYYAFQTLDDTPSFFENFETGSYLTNFNHGAFQGTDDWTWYSGSGFPSDSHVFKADGVPSVKDIYLKTKNVSIKANSRLTFYHKFKLEPGFDGAVAEISTDNGVKWKDLGNYITSGGYEGMIALFSGNPLKARLAWTYVWGDGGYAFKKSWIDLDHFRGKTAQIRFRLATDDSVILPDSAWYVDDVKVSYDNDCANTLFVRLDKWNYGPSSPYNKVHIRVLDPSLASAATVKALVESETEVTPEQVTLTRTASNVYEGDVNVKEGGTAAGDGYISCSNGNLIKVTYISSSNGGTSNPDKAYAQAYYYLPQLRFSPPLNEGVTKFNNDLTNALVFPFELSALGADIIVSSIKFKQTADSKLDPPRDVLPNGVTLYEDTNEDRTFNAEDKLIGTTSYDPVNGAVFSGLNYTVTRDNAPRIFMMLSLSENVPFGTKFQIEVPNLATDFVAKIADNTVIVPTSDKPAKGLICKIVSRALLVNQNAPTIFLEDGETWETAYHTLGDAIIEAGNRASRSKTPVEVWAAKGRYMEFLLEPYNKHIRGGVELYGGFGGDEANKVAPRKYIMETMIERPERGYAEEYLDDYYYQIDMYGGSTIDGFNIYADNNQILRPYSINWPVTGGIYLKPYATDGVNRDGVKISNCVFHNFKEFAIRNSVDSNPCPNSIVSNCVFAWIGNVPVYYIGLGSQFINCTFYNTATWDVRGLQYYFTNCAWDYDERPDSKYRQSWLWAIVGEADEYNRVRNCIFGNGVYDNANIYGDYRNNIKAKPEFVNPNYYDFRLKPGSPAIDKGITEDNTNPAMILEPLDMRGNDRIISGTPDLGAYEYVPGAPIYYIKKINFEGDSEDNPVIFRPDQPVNMLLDIGAYNMPGDVVTIGGRITMNDRHFKVYRNLGLFEPTDVNSLSQIEELPFAVTLTGTPGAFYNVKMNLDFIKTDGTNERLDNTILQFALPAFVDAVNGKDPAAFDWNNKVYLIEDNGGVRKPFKTIWAAHYYMSARTFADNIKVLCAEGTYSDYINAESIASYYWMGKATILGGYNPRTWERAPEVFKSIWTGDNQRRIIRSYNNLAYKVDGFTIKDAIENAIEIYNYNSDWYHGRNEITNNTFQNINGNNIIYLYHEYANYHRFYDPYWSDIGAPISTTSTFNGSVSTLHKNTSPLALTSAEGLNLSEFTIEAWVYPTGFSRLSGSGGNPYYSHGTIMNIKISDSQYAKIAIDDYKKFAGVATMPDWGGNAPGYYDSQLRSINEVELGKWQHVALTMKKDPANPLKISCYFYVNGLIQSDWISTVASDFQLTAPTINAGYFDGCIDEVRIWDKALSADQILANRDTEISNGEGLAAAFHFNELSGEYAYSSVGDYALGTILRVSDEEPINNISNNKFIDNKAISIYIYYYTMPTLISNNIFSDNDHRVFYTHEVIPFMQFSNNVIKGNSVPNEDYLLHFDYPHNHVIVNNTIVNNNAKVIKGYFSGNGEYFGINTVMNNIIYGNTGKTTDATISGRFIFNLLDSKDTADPIINPSWANNTTCTPTFDSDGYHLIKGSCPIEKGPRIFNTSAFQKKLASVPDPVIYFDDSSANFSIWGDGKYYDYSGYGSYANTWKYIYQSPIACNWNMQTLPAGKWEISVNLIDMSNAFDADVQYKVSHNGGDTIVNVNQLTNKGKWFSLGTYEFNGNGVVWLDVSPTIPYGQVANADCIRARFVPDAPPVGTTALPPSGTMSNFWNIDTDIDGQTRPTSKAWDIGADQYFSNTDQGPRVKVNLVSGSAHLAGIPFTVELKLDRNYDNYPAGFNFRIQYPENSITALTAAAGTLSATPVLGAETSAGGGLVYRDLTASGNTSNTQRNPQLVKLTFTIADPFPSNMTIDILPAASGNTVTDTTGGKINVSIDDSLLADLAILAPNPTANFSAVPTRGLINPDAGLFLTVYFQDASLGFVTSWEWDFGDGTSKEYKRNPSHEYIAPGSYTITLTVQGPYGQSTKVRQDYIVASDPRETAKANFTADPWSDANNRVEGPSPLKVEFLDATNGPVTTYEWDFGDGTEKSNAQNPSHIYENQGDYTVTLKIDDPMGPDTKTKTNFVHVVAPAPIQAAFTVDRLTGFAPHSVNFQNTSSGSDIQFFYYDFGDGNWSQDSITTHQYILPGSYNSTLTIAGANGFDVSAPKTIKVDQAFPLRMLNKILLGEITKTPELITTYDFNSDGKLDVADIVYYVKNY